MRFMDVKHPSMMDVVPRFAAPSEIQLTCNDSEVTASPEVMHVINAVNALICIVGLGGNGLVFYVVCRFSAMRTVTNVFILMLALADIAFLVNIPFLMTTIIMENWLFGNAYCKIYYSMTTVNQFASSFFLVTMSADRYVAICLPIRSRQIRTTATAALVSCVVWALATMLMYPVFLYAETDSTSDGRVNHCNIFWPDSFHVSGNHAFVLYCFVLGYAFPVAFMLTFYGLVLQKLRRRQSAQDQSNPGTTSTTIVSPTGATATSKRRTRLRRVTVMIFVVILVYLLCWTPYWVSQLFISFSASHQFNHLLSCTLTSAEVGASQRVIYLALALQCLCFANSAVNPILYAILSENFKQSYAKACNSFARTKYIQSIVHEASCRPESCSQYAHKLSDSFTPADFDKRRIYLSCNVHTPLVGSPRTSTTGLTSAVHSDRGGGDPEEEETGDVRTIKGELKASFQITAWAPHSKNQDPVVSRRTLRTTFEMLTESGASMSL